MTMCKMFTITGMNKLRFLNLPLFMLLYGGFFTLLIGLRFVLVSQVIGFITIPLIIAATVISVVYIKPLPKGFTKTLHMLLPFIAIAFAVAKTTATQTPTFSNALVICVVLICGAIVFFSCTNTVIQTKHGESLKKILGSIYLIIIIPAVLFILFVAFISLLSGRVETKSISFPSTHGSYVAEATQYSQGALGGATHVTIRQQNDRFNILIGEIRRKPVTIFVGTYEDFHNIYLQWHSETLLHIYFNDNDVVYAFSRTSTNWVKQ